MNILPNNPDKYICSLLCEKVINYIESLNLSHQELIDFYYKFSSTCNITEYILTKYNDKPWCYDRIFHKNNLSIQFIINNKEKFESKTKLLYLLAYHKDFNEKVFEETLDLDWKQVYNILLDEKILSLDFISKYTLPCHYWINYKDFIVSEEFVLKIYNNIKHEKNDKVTYSKKLFSFINYQNVSINTIIKRTDIKWDLNKILAKKDLTFNHLILLNNKFKFKFKQYNIDRLCIIFKDIEKLINNIYLFGNYTIDYNNVSANKYITEDFIENNIDKEWNWMTLSRNKNLSYEFIDKYSYKDWLWYYIDLENAPIWFLQKYIIKLGNKKSLIYNKNIKIEHISSLNLINTIVLKMPYLNTNDVIKKLNINKKFYRNCSFLNFDYLYKDKNFLNNYDFIPEYYNIFECLKTDVKNKFQFVLEELNSVFYHPDNFKYFIIDCELMSKERLQLWDYK